MLPPAPIDDPLGVLTSTRAVVDRAVQVRIDGDRVHALADQIGREQVSGPAAFSDELHLRDGTTRTAAFILVLDTLNFCFWSSDPGARWRVRWRDEIHDGYWALVAALRRALEEGWDILDPRTLAGLGADDVALMLRPSDPGEPEIPLLQLRHRHLVELGTVLLNRFRGPDPVAELIASAEGSAVRLVKVVTEALPSFDDVTTYADRPVRFYKRAQILAADLHGAFGGKGLGAFGDLGELTAFADYKVPQVLRGFGVLDYTVDLARRIDERRLIPMGSPEEVEIRAATVWACEWIRQELGSRGTALRAFEVDWTLWQAGQSLPGDAKPYHRTLTPFY